MAVPMKSIWEVRTGCHVTLTVVWRLFSLWKICLLYTSADTILTIAAPDNPRALTPQELADAVREFHSDVRPFDNIEAAVAEAYQLAGKEDVIIAFGSLAFLGDLTEIIRKHNGGNQ